MVAAGRCEHGRKQGGAGDDVLGQNVLVSGVGSCTDGSHAIEGGNAESRGEVAVRASSGGGLVQIEAEFPGQFSGLLEESDGSCLPLHGRAIDAAGDGEFAGGIDGLEPVEEALDTGGVPGPGDADVDLNVCLGGDDVGAGSSGDDAAVYGEAAGEVGEGGDALDLAGELEDGGVAPFEVDTGVRGDTGDVNVVVADTFTGGLESEALGGLEDEDRGRFAGEFFRDGARDGAADLFFGDEQQSDRMGEIEFAKDGECREGHDDASLHVEDAGAGDRAVALLPRHGLQGSVGPDGIEMAEDEERLLAGTSGRFRSTCPEAQLVDVAEVFLSVLFDSSVQGGGPAGDELLGGVNRGRIFAWTFHLNKSAKVLEEPG